MQNNEGPSGVQGPPWDRHSPSAWEHQGSQSGADRSQAQAPCSSLNLCPPTAPRQALHPQDVSLTKPAAEACRERPWCTSGHILDAAPVGEGARLPGVFEDFFIVDSDLNGLLSESIPS